LAEQTGSGVLAGKTALVTGGSRGIGRAIVERLSHDGADMVFSFASRQTAAEEVVAAVQATGGNAMQQAARRLRDGGRIVNLSSVNTVLPAPGVAIYAASKAAVEQFTVVAARELAGRGITVNTVSPGGTDTEMFRGANPPGAPEWAAAITPLGRLGQPADVADVVAFLVGPDGRWLTGQNLHASGGLA
jgi:NAD(P)-dependent dehydrogenase (short-subunit alcohol dehydrogenase family)